MKKTLSILLAALMLLGTSVPAFAAETHTVTFIQPSPEFEDGYFFVKSTNGVVEYQEDDDGDYVFFDNRYMTLDNIFENYRPENPQFYSPVELDPSAAYEDGTVLTFQVMTSAKYNLATATVFINGEQASLNTQGEYAVLVDRDLSIKVGEYDEGGAQSLLRSHFTVKLTSGEGYKCKTLKNENYDVVYYGDSFSFRIKVDSGYSASGITVGIERGNDQLSEIIGEEFGTLGNLLGKNEIITSYGIDDEGCRLYKIDNITTDCKIVVTGVRAENTSNLLAVLKRILRLILDWLGIKSDKIAGLVAYYNVEIANNNPSVVSYTLVQGSDKTDGVENLTVTSGEGLTLIVTKHDSNKDVTVFWTPGNEYGTYTTKWIGSYDPYTGETVYTAVYNIDSIKADTAVRIVCNN